MNGSRESAGPFVVGGGAEVVLYHENSSLCDKLFGSNAKDHMLKNKTESAYTLLEQEETINVPTYIREAIEWIRS